MEGIVGRRGGRGRTHCVDCEGKSQVNDHEPQYKAQPEQYQMEREEQVEGDDEKVEEQVGLEPEPESLEDYPGGPYDLSVLTIYHVHVARRMSDGRVRLYTFYLLCWVFNLN